MALQILTATFILLTLAVICIGLKSFFDKDAKLIAHSCDFDKNKSSVNGEDCSLCDITDLSNCSDDQR